MDCSRKRSAYFGYSQANIVTSKICTFASVQLRTFPSDMRVFLVDHMHQLDSAAEVRSISSAAPFAACCVRNRLSVRQLVFTHGFYLSALAIFRHLSSARRTLESRLIICFVDSPPDKFDDVSEQCLLRVR